MAIPADLAATGDDTGAEVLDDVVLESFTASPDHIGPFGASHLAWSVEGRRASGWS